MQVFEGRTAKTIAANARAAGQATLSAGRGNFNRRAMGGTLPAPVEAAGEVAWRPSKRRADRRNAAVLVQGVPAGPNLVRPDEQIPGWQRHSQPGRHQRPAAVANDKASHVRAGDHPARLLRAVQTPDARLLPLRFARVQTVRQLRIWRRSLDVIARVLAPVLKRKAVRGLSPVPWPKRPASPRRRNWRWIPTGAASRSPLTGKATARSSSGACGPRDEIARVVNPAYRNLEQDIKSKARK